MTRIYFESKNHAEDVGLIDDFYYDEIYPHLEKIAKKYRMFITESTEIEPVQYAKDILEENGYCVDVLWHAFDLNEDNLSDIVKMKVINRALRSEKVKETIRLAMAEQLENFLNEPF